MSSNKPGRNSDMSKLLDKAPNAITIWSIDNSLWLARSTVLVQKFVSKTPHSSIAVCVWKNWKNLLSWGFNKNPLGLNFRGKGCDPGVCRDVGRSF